MENGFDFSYNSFCRVNLCCDNTYAPEHISAVERGPAGFEVVYALSGPCKIEIFDADGTAVREQYNLFIGDFLFFNGGLPRRLSAGKYGARVLRLQVSLQPQRMFPSQKPFPAFLAADPAVNEFFQSAPAAVRLYDDGHVLDSLYMTAGKYNSSSKKTALEPLLQVLLIDVAHLYITKQKSFKGNIYVKKAVYEIESNLNTANAAKVAQKLNISRTYLQRLFKDTFGKGVADYITELWIARAIRYFKVMPGKTITDAARHFGCPRVTFERMFKRVTGKTPGEYRNEMYLPDDFLTK